MDTNDKEFDLAAWQAEVQKYIDLLNEREKRDFGPNSAEINEFLPPTHLELLAVLEEKLGHALPDEFKQFHTQAGAASFPSACNGYWIVSLDIVARAIERFDFPTVIKNGSEIPTLVFGNDGGGQMFTLYLDEEHYGSVYYLPHSINKDGIYEHSMGFPPLRLATSFFGFLRRLRDDVIADLENKEDWKYMDYYLYRNSSEID